VKILKKAFGSYRISGSELLFHCPKCNHEKPKMSVNIEKDAFKCWICDYSGNKISYLISKYGANHYSDWSNLVDEIDLSEYEFIFSEKSAVSNIDLDLPHEFKTLTGKKHGSKNKPLNYLYKRGLTDFDILKWKIGFCDYGDYAGRIIVPSFDSGGNLNYFIARSYYGDWMKYKNPKASKNIIFNDLNINWNKDIVLVEGVFDAIRHDNCIPLLGSSLREDHVLFEKICRNKKEVYLALDNDAKQKEIYISKKFKQYGVSVKSIRISPYSDAAEMPVKEFNDRKLKAEIMSEFDYIKYKLNF